MHMRSGYCSMNNDNRHYTPPSNQSWRRKGKTREQWRSSETQWSSSRIPKMVYLTNIDGIKVAYHNWVVYIEPLRLSIIESNC